MVVLAAGCASNRPAPASKSASDREPYRLESEGQAELDESTIRREVDRIDEFEEVAVTESDFPVQDVEPVEDAAPVDTPVDSTLTSAPGYRVQIFAASGRVSAEAMRKTVAEVMGVPAYVEQVDGVYKVRVGDCRSRPEAEDLLQRCRQSGYADAWIVSSMVFYKRLEG
jgi:cell division septation protein DedD